MLGPCITRFNLQDETYFGVGCRQKEEEIQSLQKHISMLEGELDEVHTQFAEATTKLGTTEKQLALVTHTAPYQSILLQPQPLRCELVISL